MSRRAMPIPYAPVDVAGGDIKVGDWVRFYAENKTLRAKRELQQLRQELKNSALFLSLPLARIRLG